MNLKRLLGGVLSLAIVAGLGAAGCTEGYKWPRLEGKWTEKPQTRAAAPAPAPAPAAPARTEPAPRAAAPAPSGASVMYLPTGERSTSSLMIEKIAPSEVVAGAPFDYTIRVTNLTGLSLDNVVVTDTLSPNFKVNSSTPQAEGTYRWSLGTLRGGESKDIKINGQATSVQPLTSCAGVTWTTALCININVVQPALKLTKSATPEITVCDTIQYRLVVSNPGSGPARGVKVRDPLPAGVESSGKTVMEFDAGDLAAGQSKEFTFTAKAGKPGTYTNAATATAANGLTADSGEVQTVVRQPVLTIKAECPTGTIMQGRNATFKFTVCNTGDAPSTGTTLTAQVPAGVTFVSADSGGASQASNVTWNIGTLAPKECKTYSYTVRTVGAGELRACATVSGNCAAAVSDCCTSSVKGVPDIGIGLEDDDGVVQVGENHVFRYVVKNQGQVDLTNVKVVATFDDGLDYVSSTWSGAQAQGRTVTFNLGTLPIGKELNFTFTAKGTKAGQLIVQTVTTSDQTKPVRADEQVNYVER